MGQPILFGPAFGQASPTLYEATDQNESNIKILKIIINNNFTNFVKMYYCNNHKKERGAKKKLLRLNPP